MQGLCKSALAAVTKIPWTGRLKQQTFLSHNLEARQSRFGVQAGLVFGEDPLPGLQTGLVSSHS